MEINKIISDENEVKKFYDNIMQPLDDNELYFLTLAARNKYLTEEEREVYRLGRSEMFARTLYKYSTFEKFISRIYRYQTDPRGYTTKNGKPIPQKALVCYVNINPSSTLKGLTEFERTTDDIKNCIINSSIKHKEADFTKLRTLHSKFETSFQNAASRRIWMDFDLDIDKSFLFWENPIFKDFMKDKGLTNTWILDTHSGYHMLIDVSQLHFDPSLIIEKIIRIIPNDLELGEVIKNENGMVPLPGTLQGNYPVTMKKLGDIL